MTAMALSTARDPFASLDSASSRGKDAELVVQMAHDLRSPLSAILVLAEALQCGQSGPVTEAQKRQLGLIYSAALSLCSSASDMLEMARAGEGLANERTTTFSVSAVLQSVRDMVQPMVDERSLELRVVAPDIDRREGRPRTLTRVLLNLATNALKSTNSGFVELAVRELPGNPKFVECAVRDTGCGLEPSVLRSLFGAPGTDAQDGAMQSLTSAGLGLGLCRRLVASMGSTLAVSSRPLRGTCFSFALALPSVTARS